MNSFDKKIKEKLEQISEVGADKAWQRLQMSLPQPFYIHFLKNYAGWAFAGILATILVLQNVNSNEINVKSVADGKSEITSNGIPQTASKTDTVFTEKVIYKDRIIYKNIGTFKTIDNKEVATNKDINENIFTLNDKNNLVKNEEKLNIQKERASVNESIEPAKIQTKNSTELPTNVTSANKEISDLPSPNGAIVIQNNNIKENQQTAPTIIQKLDNSSAISNPDLPIESPIIETPMVVDPKVNLAKADPLESPKTDIGNSNSKDFKPKAQIYKKINTRIGFESKIQGDEKVSFGPLLEIFFAKQFSFTSGILFGNNHSKEFKQPADFNKKTGKRFEDFYRPKLGDKPQEIKDIQINTSSINVPLQFSYYFPFKNNISLITNAAAVLTFNEKDAVIFEGKLPFEEGFTKTFENKRPTKVLSAFNYGMGVQYAYKRLYFQVLPNFNFPTQKSFFFNERNRFGIDAAIKFSLKK
jgi:hypothetical protein